MAEYSEELLPHLARHAEIELIVDGYVPSNPALRAAFPIRDVRQVADLVEARRYDALLYHVGNSPVHECAYQTLARYPGVTVLHDYVLHHLVVAMTAAKGDEHAYVRELGYCHGRAGLEAARRAIRSNHDFPYLDFPANRRVLDASLGVIVHSAYVRDLVAAAAPSRPIAVVPLHALPMRVTAEREKARRALGVGAEAVVYASFGLVTPSKRLDVALRAFRRVREDLPTSRYLVVGESPAQHDPRPLVAELGLSDSVAFTGYVEKQDLLAYVTAADVGINLRWPVLGETSASLLRLLAAGKATIVTGAGPFAEFPDDCCVKIPVGLDEEDRLAAAMLRLGQDAGARETLGRAARQHVEAHHRIEDSARKYAEFLEAVLG